MKYLALILATGMLFSCAMHKTKTDKISHEQTVSDSITGKVQEIQRGKDGYTAQIITNDNVTYFATVSISNLNDPKQYKDVAVGQTIKVKGEHWKMEELNYITVRDFVIQ